MSSIINVAYQQRLFTMLSSNLIKMFRVKRNILTMYEQKSIKSLFSSVLVFCPQKFEICIDISIFQALFNFPSQVSVIERRQCQCLFCHPFDQDTFHRDYSVYCALFTTSRLRHVSANLHTIYANLMWSKSESISR